MRALFICSALLAALPAQAAIYKCPGEGGRVIFSDRPCAGAAESPEQEIQVDTYEVGGTLATPQQLKQQGQADPVRRSQMLLSNGVCRSFSSTELRRLVIQNQVVVGMTSGAAGQAWGSPTRVNGSQWAYHWAKGGSSYLYMEDGCVRAVNGGYNG